MPLQLSTDWRRPPCAYSRLALNPPTTRDRRKHDVTTQVTAGRNNLAKIVRSRPMYRAAKRGHP
jgi:hypothetical protein